MKVTQSSRLNFLFTWTELQEPEVGVVLPGNKIPGIIHHIASSLEEAGCSLGLQLRGAQVKPVPLWNQLHYM